MHALFHCALAAALMAISMIAVAEEDDGVPAGPGLPPLEAAQPAPPLKAKIRDFQQRSARTMAPDDVVPHAAAFLPYAMLATVVYCNDIYRRQQEAAAGAASADAGCNGGIRARDHGWQRLNTYTSDHEAGSTDLPAGEPWLGLRFAVFYRVEGQTVSVGIAFRGTDFKSLADWHSNLRWFLPGRDQYDQVATMVSDVIAKTKADIEHALGHEVEQWHIVTTGHSLGGGLAQLFAYSSAAVAAAVVFDPSPVTGYYSCVDKRKLNCNVPVWRIYEQGEILSYVRSVTRLFIPLSENITEVEFDLVDGNPIVNHSMTRFYRQLKGEVKLRPVPEDQVAKLIHGRPDCDCSERRNQGLFSAVRNQCAELRAQSFMARPLASLSE